MASTTILIAGMAAIVECDLKKIIALSTLSQLGVIVSTLAIGLPTLAFFHLITHALFKALLFICAGALIHHFSHAQDLRHVAAACPQAPTISSCILIANLALSGSPFLAGFYSKDLIIEILLLNPVNILIILTFLAATLLTAAYSTRLLIILLWTPPSFSPLHNTHREDQNFTYPIVSLACAAITSGSLIN